MTAAVANAARLGVGLGAVCPDVVESLNGILKRAYNDHTARGGGGMPGATSLEREAEVVLEVWEWWFLKFDLPLRTLGTPHVAPCAMATLMSNHSPPPMSLSLAPPALVSPIHRSMDPAAMEALVEKTMQNMTDKVVCACACVFAYESYLLSVSFV